MTAEVMQVIKTRLLQRGDGKSDPFRTITQYWSLSGELLAEVDPFPFVQRLPDADASPPRGFPGKAFQ